MSSRMNSPSPPATGFILLTIDNCRLISSTGDPPDKFGTLSLICVTLDVGVTEAQFGGIEIPQPSSSSDASQTRDVWLVLRIDGYEFPVSPSQLILHSRSQRTFTFQAPEAAARTTPKPNLTLVVPDPAQVGAHLLEDIETLEVLLSQYGIMQEIDRDDYGTDGDLKGRLVLVDQNDGEYVGWLGSDLQVTEDPLVEQTGKDPVVVEISEDGQNINVHPVQAEDRDLLLGTAGLISRGIVFVGDTLAGGISYASKYYVAHSTPTEKPLEFSENTRSSVRRVHQISGQAVKITTKTTGMIHGLIDNMAGRIGGLSSSNTPTGSRVGTPGAQSGLKGQGTGTGTGTGTGQGQAAPPSPPKKARFLNRLLLSTDMIISAIEQSATTVIASGSRGVTNGIQHKYGDHAGEAADAMGRTVQNVSMIYIDVRGVGRRALLKRMGKGVVKAKLGNKDVVLGINEPGAGPTSVPAPTSGVGTPPAYSSSVSPNPALSNPNLSLNSKTTGPPPPLPSRSRPTTPLGQLSPQNQYPYQPYAPQSKSARQLNVPGDSASGLRSRSVSPPPLPPREKSSRP